MQSIANYVPEQNHENGWPMAPVPDRICHELHWSCQTRLCGWLVPAHVVTLLGLSASQPGQTA